MGTIIFILAALCALELIAFAALVSALISKSKREKDYMIEIPETRKRGNRGRR